MVNHFRCCQSAVPLALSTERKALEVIGSRLLPSPRIPALPAVHPLVVLALHSHCARIVLRRSGWHRVFPSLQQTLFEKTNPLRFLGHPKTPQIQFQCLSNRHPSSTLRGLRWPYQRISQHRDINEFHSCAYAWKEVCASVRATATGYNYHFILLTSTISATYLTCTASTRLFSACAAYS